MLFVLLIIFTVLSYLLHVRVRVLYFVTYTIIVFYLAELRIDALRLRTEEDLKAFFILTLLFTCLISLRRADAVVAFRYLANNSQRCRAYFKQHIYKRIQRQFTRRLSHEERTYFRHTLRFLLKKLEQKTSPTTYREARKAQRRLLHCLELDEAGYIGIHDTHDIRNITHYCLASLDKMVRTPTVHVTPETDHQLYARLQRINHYLQQYLN